MVAPEELLALTDDEVVAIAASREANWPGGTPTVGVHEDERKAAAFRGNRSLAVRGLIVDADYAIQVLDLRNRVFTQPLLYAYFADDAFAAVAPGIVNALYAGSEDWLLETVAAVGVHEFVQRPKADHVAYLDALLSGVVANGPESAAPGEPSCLCLLAIHGDAGFIAVATRGGVRCGAVALQQGEAPSPSGELVAVTPADAVAQLVAALS